MKVAIPNIFKGLERNALVTAVSVVLIYGLNFIGVEFFRLPPQLAYFTAMGLNYVYAYFWFAKIFGRIATKKNLVRYIIVIIFFFVLNNLTFYVLINNYHIHYLIAITINFIIFPLLKFLSHKYIVYQG